MITCLQSAADSTIPSAGTGQHPSIAGWSQFVKLELSASRWWYKLWGMLVFSQLVFCFSLKSMLTGGKNMLSVESREKRSVSSEYHKSVPAHAVDCVSSTENVGN